MLVGGDSLWSCEFGTWKEYQQAGIGLRLQRIIVVIDLLARRFYKT